ncbi:MAG: hypothetical protein SFX18_15425 [Pirellulales bacterium]|nr:hypothetical protein [Pirellulales bacterium]
MPQSAPSAVPTPPMETWSEAARGIVSVLIVAHLLGLVLVFWANNERANERMADSVRKVKQVWNAYLYPLWLDRTWDQRITSLAAVDADHFFEVNLPRQGQIVTFRYPPADASAAEGERWRQVGKLIALQADLDPGEPDSLVRDLAGGWRRQLQGQGEEVNRLDIVLRRRPRANYDNPAANSAPDRVETAYQATIKWTAEGEAFLNKPVTDPRDVAPVVTVNGNNSAANTPPVSAAGASSAKRPPVVLPPGGGNFEQPPPPAPRPVPLDQLPEVK